MSTTPTPSLAAEGGLPTRMRTSNAERDRVAALVETSVAQGTLTPAEGEQRLQAIRAATFRDELEAPVADLPLAASTPGWRPGGDGARRSVGSAFAALLAALGALILRHRVLTAVVLLIVVAAVVALAFSDLDSHGGEGHGHHFHGGRGR